MPVVPPHTYPGVYIQEVPSGVHTIVGVSTSITAFLGRTARGPTNEPVAINSYMDFERIFGGLWSQSRLGYAVRDFYRNGGSQAIIVRLYHPDDQAHAGQPALDNASAANAGSADGGASNGGTSNGGSANGGSPNGASYAGSARLLEDKGLPLVAANPGAWGNNLRARVDAQVGKGIGQRYGLNDGDLFNLTVLDTATGVMETYRNVSVKPGQRQIDKMLADGSRLVRLAGALPTTLPTTHADQPAKDKSIWEDNATSSGIKENGSDGLALSAKDFSTEEGLQAAKQGLYALDRVDLFNILCIPPFEGDDVDPQVITDAAAYCERRRAVLIVDPPSDWDTKDAAKNGIAQGIGTTSKNAMLFFPRIRQPDPLFGNQLTDFVPCGAIAGVIARTDAQRGVWKAPAGLEATLNGVSQLSVPLTDDENGELNPLGINCLRSLPAVGPVIWGARTLQGDDRLESEWKYTPVRRLTLFIEESLYRGTRWAVFEPNDEPLWAQLRLNIGAFLHGLFRQGAFQGQKPQDAYFVRCDATTTTQTDIDQGIVNIMVGFAPVKPAEFVILYIQQIAGQIAV